MSFVYYISSDRMGNQDPDLGKKLLHNFFIKLLDSPAKPTHILLVESGVKLLLPSFTAIDALKILETEMEIEFLACQTCLDYYGIREQLTVGKISNMPEIIQTMHEADKVIHL